MIPFDDLVASLERYKLRKLAAAGAAPAGKPVSGKPAQPAAGQHISVSGGLEAAELLPED
jgi:hypothetical protein